MMLNAIGFMRRKPNAITPWRQLESPAEDARSFVILIRFQDELNIGRVSAWQDHAGLIHSLLSGRN